MFSTIPYRILQLIFFGNYFYGLCVVALSIEAGLQHGYPLNTPLYYILAFSATVVYYSKAYIKTETSPESSNQRSAWYASNKPLIIKSQWLLTSTVAIGALWFIMRYAGHLAHLYWYEYLLIIAFPLVSVLYYGMDLTTNASYSLRHVGWLKPFVIGFAWAGMCNVYPVQFQAIQTGTHYALTQTGLLLFLENFMFITVLSIMFDIKDYAMDYNLQLKTFVVKAGLRNTIFCILMPLTLLGLASFLAYSLRHQFHPAKMLINAVPLLLVLPVAYSLQARRSIFYYLIIIDGLMLVKALCGITATRLF